MFHPLDRPMQRGWLGRVDSDRVVHLAAQTLQSFFSGGGRAREHAEYPRAEVGFLPPVLHPPTVRLFEAQEEFAFANAAAVAGPDAVVRARGPLVVHPRLAAVIGDEESLGGFTLLAEYRAPELPAPKDRDFALAFGPVVVTPDELDPAAVEIVLLGRGGEQFRAEAPPFDWEEARALAGRGTALHAGDLIAGPAFGTVTVEPGPVELRAESIGVLPGRVAGD
jgi:hypothetical protein